MDDNTPKLTPGNHPGEITVIKIPNPNGAKGTGNAAKAKEFTTVTETSEKKPRKWEITGFPAVLLLILFVLLLGVVCGFIATTFTNQNESEIVEATRVGYSPGDSPRNTSVPAVTPRATLTQTPSPTVTPAPTSTPVNTPAPFEVMAPEVMVAQSVAPTGAYDLNWLNEIVRGENAMELLILAWDNRSGDKWKVYHRNTETYGIPANSVVFGAVMRTGNQPAFQQVSPTIYYTAEGGRFGAETPFMAFQLDGLVPTSNPATIDQMILVIEIESEYGRKIEQLDIQWSNSDLIINRWGSSGPLELLTEEEVATIGLQNLTPVSQQLPGNTLVWGELAPGETHYGLVRVAENVYATTCEGGLFVTLRGFRAMQFAPASNGSVIPDTTGCNGAYPPLNPERPASASPLD